MKDNESLRLSSFKKIRYSPEVRSAYVERFEEGPDVLTLFGKALYLDDSVLLNSQKTYVQMNIMRAGLLFLRTGPSYVEVPEPLWTRKMLHTLFLLVCAHVGGAMRFRRTTTSTYCIENEDPARIARLPEAVPRRLRIGALRPPLIIFSLLIRRWVFGTEASRETYAAIMGGAWRAVAERSSLVWPLPSVCVCPPAMPSARGRILFLGAVTSRKGIVELLTAWDNLEQLEHSLHLSILGSGELSGLVEEWAGDREDVTLLSNPSRSQIHAELRQADVVVLLSKPERYWREQIGLPLLEGLAHGCRIVTTEQTGIASWLARSGHFVIGDPQNSSAVAEAIRSAVLAGPWSTDPLPRINGRASAAVLMHE